MESFCSDFSSCNWLHDDKVVECLFHASRIPSVASKIGFQKRLDKASNLFRIDRVAFTRDF